jgi:REP-associated tyrosine transposase
MSRGPSRPRCGRGWRNGHRTGGGRARQRIFAQAKDDGFTALAPIRDRFPCFADLLAIEPEADRFEHLRVAESLGRPLGNDRFLARIERRTGRVLKPGRRGPKPLGSESR